MLDEEKNEIHIEAIKKLIDKLYNEEKENDFEMLETIEQQKSNNDDFNNVCDIFNKYMKNVFCIYAGKEDSISIEKAYQICYDFKLFPDFLTKNEVTELYRKALKHEASKEENEGKDFNELNAENCEMKVNNKSVKFSKTILVFLLIKILHSKN